MIRPLVYLAGPITKGRPTRFHNLADAFQAMAYLWERGVAAYVPHVGMLLDFSLPGMGYESWMEHGFSIIAKCDCLIRLPGESEGADQEVTFALNRGISVVIGSDWISLCNEAVKKLKYWGKLA